MFANRCADSRAGWMSDPNIRPPEGAEVAWFTDAKILAERSGDVKSGHSVVYSWWNRAVRPAVTHGIDVRNAIHRKRSFRSVTGKVRI